MNILIVAAHPDDEVLGCGGTIARLCDEGHDVYVVIMSRGVASRYDSIEDVQKNELDTLAFHSKKSAAILGAKKVIFFDFPDNSFDSVPLLDVVKPLEKCITDLDPSEIYTHFGGDLNIDHQRTFQAVLTATRPQAGSQLVKRIFSFEIPSSTEWAFGKIYKPFNPNHFVNVSRTINRKVEAMKCYEGELREFPHPRSIEAIQSSAATRGAAAGVEAAEAFEVVRSIST